MVELNSVVILYIYIFGFNATVISIQLFLKKYLKLSAEEKYYWHASHPYIYPHPFATGLVILKQQKQHSKHDSIVHVRYIIQQP